MKLKEKYKKVIIPALMKEMDYKNPMQVPKLFKIVINRGVGEATVNPKALDIVVEELTAISGQKPLVTRAKIAIANFKLKAKTPIGCKVTLRKDRMYEFLDKLLNICLPRIRDFKGLNPNSFDGRGNYTFGIKDQLIFPEIIYDKVDKARGMDITICTSAKTDKEARTFLTFLGMPFEKRAIKKDREKVSG